MNRLTKEDTNKVCYDCWELCGLDDVCKRDCFKPTPCKIPSMISKLAKYEDTGIEPDELQKVTEKQTPKKVKKIRHEHSLGYSDIYYCPNCHGSVWQIRCESNYCFRCGQKLDWEIKK